MVSWHLVPSQKEMTGTIARPPQPSRLEVNRVAASEHNALESHPLFLQPTDDWAMP